VESAGKTVSMEELRGVYRPVIICGTRAFCRRAVDSSKPYFEALRERGVAGKLMIVCSGGVQ